MRVALIIAAGGRSARYAAAGGLRSKLDEDLGGRPVLQRTLELFVKNDSISPLLGPIIVAGPNDPDDPRAFAEFAERHADRLAMLGARLVKGGVTHRWETVLAALRALDEGKGEAWTHVAVHDAARPCTPPELLDRVFDAAERYPGVVPGVDIGDTIKRVREQASEGAGEDRIASILGVSPKEGGTIRVIEQTVPREGLVAIQTPQVFEAALFRAAYAQADLSSTDDSALVERAMKPGASSKSGGPGGVVVVPGDPRNIKITRPADLDLARAILGVRPPEGRPVHKRF